MPFPNNWMQLGLTRPPCCCLCAYQKLAHDLKTRYRLSKGTLKYSCLPQLGGNKRNVPRRFACCESFDKSAGHSQGVPDRQQQLRSWTTWFTGSSSSLVGASCFVPGTASIASEQLGKSSQRCVQPLTAQAHSTHFSRCTSMLAPPVSAGTFLLRCSLAATSTSVKNLIRR